MLNLALPSLARDLGATVTDAQWVQNAYYLALVSCVLAAGAVGDVVGHRHVFVAGILAFCAGAGLCAGAPAVWPMAAGRFVQGIGAPGLPMVTSLGDANRSASSAERP